MQRTFIALLFGLLAAILMMGVIGYRELSLPGVSRLTYPTPPAKETSTGWKTDMGSEARDLDIAMEPYFPPVSQYVPGEFQRSNLGACTSGKKWSEAPPLVDVCYPVLLG